LPFHSKSATVETLVSDQCERRPPLLIGGFFSLPRGARVPWCIVIGPFPPVFLVVLYCFLSIAFFIAIARSYVVFLQIFAL
jgi:hypothetical protein